MKNNYKYVWHSIITLSMLVVINNCKGITVNNDKNLEHIKSGQKLDLSNWTTKNNLTYTITQSGTGSKPFAGEMVSVDYTGWLFNPQTNIIGTRFDSSIDRKQQFQFPLKRNYVIKGWDETVADMQIGETRLVIIPAALAYGNQNVGGIIPANSTLLFKITLHKSGK